MKKKVENKKDIFILTLNTDKDYKGEGETFQEAFDSMGLTWNIIKLKGNLIVEKGDKKTEQLFRPNELRKLINSKLLKDIWAGKFELRLK